MFRNAVAVLVCGLMFAVTATALAQDAPTKNQGLEGLQLDFLPPAEQERVRAALQAEIERAVRQAAGEAEERLTAQAEGRLSAANIADQAMDMIGSFATEATERLDQIAPPQAWRIMVRQSYANGIMRLGIPLMLMLFTLVFWRICKGFKYDEDDARAAFTKYIPLFMFSIAAIVFCCLAPQAIARFVNPEYYAIADILSMISNASN